MRPRLAFSLIELLVVVSILALLVALLLPALGGAKRHAVLTACKSNMHQQGVATHAYAHDNASRLWPQPPYDPWWSWIGFSGSSWQPADTIRIWGVVTPDWAMLGKLVGNGYTGRGITHDAASVIMCPGLSAAQWRQQRCPANPPDNVCFWPVGVGDNATPYWGKAGAGGMATYLARVTPYAPQKAVIMTTADKPGAALSVCHVWRLNLAHDGIGANAAYLDGSASFLPNRFDPAINGAPLGPNNLNGQSILGWNDTTMYPLFAQLLDGNYGR